MAASQRAPDAAGIRPNVVFVITDDQGYGDLACHGNPIIQTPNLDRMHGESLRLNNFHVGPTCAPTRAGLMTGHYCNCTGVWHTIMGRSLLRRDEITMGDVFRANGYATGMFGKWHLGDNYPFHPHNRGFDVAFYHGGGGVSQTPDYWGNDYFDDTYFDSGVPTPTEGYCTDVWFGRAMQFIDANKDRPFFCYLSTNAPHGPYNVADKYADLYRGDVPEGRARFYGMITNIDENMGRLREKLEALGIEVNTILIFMTDNGSSGGCSLDNNGFVTGGYNAGMRGMKGSEYDGGHRTPLFLRWPAAGFTKGVDVNELTANIDVLPTLIGLGGLGRADVQFDGIDLTPILADPPSRRSRGAPAACGRLCAPASSRGRNAAAGRVVVTDSQRVEYPVKWKQSATMTQRWRLVNGVELYDILADPGQRHDVAAEQPDVVAELRKHYEAWWELVSPTFDNDCPIVIGSEREEIITGHDWHGEACPWNQGMIRQGVECNGYWIVEIAADGDYAFELRRWPRQEDRAITGGITGEITDWYHGGNALPLNAARIRVAGQEREQTIPGGAKSVTFTIALKAGATRLQTWLTGAGGLSLGAYYVYARRIAGGA